MRQTATAIVVSWCILALFYVDAHAEIATLNLREQAKIEDLAFERGKWLIKCDPVDQRLLRGGDLAISRATLTFEVTGSAQERIWDLEVVPVAVDWAASSVSWSSQWEADGENLAQGLVAPVEVDLTLGAQVVAVDVTSVVLEAVRDGAAPYGFAIQGPRRLGGVLSTRDIDRISLDSAKLVIAYKAVGRDPRG